MTVLDRSFAMTEPPADAQGRFEREIGGALHRMGFRLTDSDFGHLRFGVRYWGGAMWFGWLTVAFWLWRKLMGHAIEADFEADGPGTKVSVYGKAPGDIAALVNLLGRSEHWPANREDPDWLPALADAELETDEWDDPDIDHNELDRVTRRALKKQGRLRE